MVRDGLSSMPDEGKEMPEGIKCGQETCRSMNLNKSIKQCLCSFVGPCFDQQGIGDVVLDDAMCLLITFHPFLSVFSGKG